MMNTHDKDMIEQGLTAPKVTIEDVNNNIAEEHYFTAAEGVRLVSEDSSLHLLTFCVLVMRNGYTVTGESACASPENFNRALGEKYAKEAAIRKVWPLMGYELKSKLAGK